SFLAVLIRGQAALLLLLAKALPRFVFKFAPQQPAGVIRHPPQPLLKGLINGLVGFTGSSGRLIRSGAVVGTGLSARGYALRSVLIAFSVFLRLALCL